MGSALVLITCFLLVPLLKNPGKISQNDLFFCFKIVQNYFWFFVYDENHAFWSFWAFDCVASPKTQWSEAHLPALAFEPRGSWWRWPPEWDSSPQRHLRTRSARCRSKSYNGRWFGWLAWFQTSLPRYNSRRSVNLNRGSCRSSSTRNTD